MRPCALCPNPLVPAFSFPGELHGEPDTVVACGYWLAGASGEGELTSSALYRLNVEPCECITYAEKIKTNVK